MNVELRDACVTDSEFLYQVNEAAMRSYVEKTFGSWVEAFQRRVIGESFDPSTHQIILADGAAVGILAAPDQGSHIQTEKLFIAPTHQRQGIGSFLLRGLMHDAAREGKPLRLRVLAVNVDARRFYERFGFGVTNATTERIFMEYRA